MGGVRFQSSPSYLFVWCEEGQQKSHTAGCVNPLAPSFLAAALDWVVKGEASHHGICPFPICYRGILELEMLQDFDEALVSLVWTMHLLQGPQHSVQAQIRGWLVGRSLALL